MDSDGPSMLNLNVNIDCIKMEMIMGNVGKLRDLSVIILLLLISPLVLAQNYFTVSGPLDIYVDLLTGEKIYNYSYSAKLTYQPATDGAEIYRYPHMEQVFYYDTIQSIEYSIYDEDGIVVNSGVEKGGLNNITSALDDIDFTDSIREQMYWYGDDPLVTVKTQAGISFYDSTGGIVKSVDQYPSPPNLDEIDYAGSSFYQFNQNSGAGFDAWGPVTEISFNDPFIDCASSTSNRGQYIRCATRVFFSLRKNVRYSVLQDLLKEYKNRDERWQSYVQCTGGERKLSSFNGCFRKVINAFYTQENKSASGKKAAKKLIQRKKIKTGLKKRSLVKKNKARKRVTKK